MLLHAMLLNPSPNNDATNALNVLFEQRVVKFGIPVVWSQTMETKMLTVISHNFDVSIMFNLNHVHHMNPSQADIRK